MLVFFVLGHRTDKPTPPGFSLLYHHLRNSNHICFRHRVWQMATVTKRVRSNGQQSKQPRKKKKQKRKKVFDMSRYQQRHIALLVAYHGGDHCNNNCIKVSQLYFHITHSTNAAHNNNCRRCTWKTKSIVAVISAFIMNKRTYTWTMQYTRMGMLTNRTHSRTHARTHAHGTQELSVWWVLCCQYLQQITAASRTRKTRKIQSSTISLLVITIWFMN